VNVLRQGNPTDEGAGVDEDRLAVSEPVAHEPVNGAGDDIRPQAEPPSVLTEPTWGRPIDTTVVAPPERVKNRRIATWGQVAIILAGLAALVFGVGAVILGGLAGSVTEPVVQVFTYDHTPLLGLIETGAGLVLVVCAFVPGGRWVAGPIGVGAIVGGALIVAQLDWIQENLAAEQRFGWVAIGVGSVAYLGAMVPTKKRVVASR
jgi:hypothetical protein